MPFVSAAFKPGAALEYIKSIEDPDEKHMALAEYYQYSGRAQEAVDIAREYLSHEDPALKITAHIVCFISGIAIGDASMARKALLSLENMDVPDDDPCTGHYAANILKIMLFFKDDEIDVPDSVPSTLPEGTRFFVCYFLALLEYLRGEYEESIGMAKNALGLGGENYPIAAIYLHIISAASLMRLKRLEDAEQHFELACEVAEPDCLFAPFAQQYVLLAGLNKKCIKKRHPEKYQEVSRYANTFIATWIDTHDGLVDWHTNCGLTKAEHIVAMLFGKGFSAKEIAGLMSLSINTVKTHISRAYRKTESKSRDELPTNIIR